MGVVLEVLFDRLPEITAALTPKAQTVIDAAASHISERAAELIRTSPGGGRTYKRHGGSHTASAPGEPAANDTGDLAGSIAAHPHTGDLEAEVHVTSGHAVYTELGTSKMAARPYLQPAAHEEEPKLAAAIRAVVNL